MCVSASERLSGALAVALRHVRVHRCACARWTASRTCSSAACACQRTLRCCRPCSVPPRAAPWRAPKHAQKPWALTCPCHMAHVGALRAAAGHAQCRCQQPVARAQTLLEPLVTSFQLGSHLHTAHRPLASRVLGHAFQLASSDLKVHSQRYGSPLPACSLHFRCCPAP